MDDANGPWPFLSTTSEDEKTTLARIEGGWAYEMRLWRQNGCWVVTQLRVFPDSDDLPLKWLRDTTKFEMKVGDADEAAKRARELAHFALRRPQQDAPVSVPPGGLTARNLRRIPFGRHSSPGLLNLIHAGAGRIVKSYGRRGRLGPGNARLARIASLYVEALNRRSRTQNVDVARQLKMEGSQVRDAIHLARQKGLLSSTRQRGVPGGELTPKAVELLRSADIEATARPASRETSDSRRQPSTRYRRRSRRRRR